MVDKYLWLEGMYVVGGYVWLRFVAVGWVWVVLECV